MIFSVNPIEEPGGGSLSISAGGSRAGVGDGVGGRLVDWVGKGVCRANPGREQAMLTNIISANNPATRRLLFFWTGRDVCIKISPREEEETELIGVGRSVIKPFCHLLNIFSMMTLIG
jgi:hypothetical protein